MKRSPRNTLSPLKIAAPPVPGGPPGAAGPSQSPDYTVTGITDSGGRVLSNVEVAAIFWGRYWSSTSPVPSPSSDTYYQAFTGLVTGPFMTGLRQYRNVGPGTMLGKFINDSSDPANGYTDSDVVAMLTALFQNNPGVPAPVAGHDRFYAVVTPPGIDNSATATESLVGEHQKFTYNGIPVFYCWIDGEGGLTNDSSDGVVNVFSHELVEACTDPLFTAFHVNGQRADGTSVINDELADTCNNEFAIVEINGVNCNVQCYWSDADKACVIPLGRLSFLINKSTFAPAEVQKAISDNYGVFPGALWVALDDFSVNTFRSFNVAIPTPAGPFASLPGVTISPSPATPGGPTPAAPVPVYDNPDPSVIQQIRFSFDVTFGKPLTTPFPASGAAPYTLTATFTTSGVAVPGASSQATVTFQLTSGAGP